MNSSDGSSWRKWDLHIHTPASFHWNGGLRFRDMSRDQVSASIKEILSTINSSDIAAFAIMDYFTFDGYLNITDYLDKNSNGQLLKTLFPGMELRIESPVDFRMNLQVVFSDKVRKQQLTDFKANLRIRINTEERILSDDALIELANSLDSSKLKAVGANRADLGNKEIALMVGSKVAEVTRDSFQKAINAFSKGNVLTIFPFDTADGLAGLNWKQHPHSAHELMLLGDIFESRRKETQDLFLNVRTAKNDHFIDNFFEAIGNRPRPVISGSDAHKIEEFGVFPNEKATWLKADPTWRGLVNVTNEPNLRSFVGKILPQVQRVDEKATKYLKSLRVNKIDGKRFDGIWFNNQVPLNPGLVAIIGNKGSGKSALVDLLGLLGNSKRQVYFPFLSERAFCEPKINLAQYFEAKLEWRSKAIVEKNLDSKVSDNDLEQVNYIPQDFFEVICNELAAGKESNFDKELKGVIFSHVDEADRLEQPDLDSLVAYKTNAIEESTLRLRQKLMKAIGDIVQIEEEMKETHRSDINRKLEAKKQELIALEATRPEKVYKPRKKKSQENDELEKLLAEKERISKEIVSLNNRKSTVTRNLADLENAIERFGLLKSQFQDAINETRSTLNILGIDLDKHLRLIMNLGPLHEKKKELRAEREKVSAGLDSGNESGPAFKLETINKRVSILQGKMDEPNKKYRTYKEEEEAWRAKQKELVGTKTKPDTIKYLENKLEQLELLPEELNNKRSERDQLVEEIYLQIRKRAEVYQELYAPVQGFIESHPLARNKVDLVFDVSIINTGFEEKFFDHVHRGMTGSFYGRDEGEVLLGKTIRKFDFASFDNVRGFLAEISNLLEINISTGEANEVGNQLRKEKSVEEVYTLIFSLEYLEPRYTLKMGSKDLDQLSPGEKGTLLLIFYLLVDRSESPLIIDQPEHNLDNETIFTVLVPAIKEARDRRQIIVVTHNPNIAVVSDADQIIVADIDKSNKNKVTYLSGSIENPTINKTLLDILEGTKPAFDNRETKYTMPQ